jgi:regulator of CtrA degradation
MRSTSPFASSLHRRLVDSLYVEAMVMADEARSYFDTGLAGEQGFDDPLQRIAFTCESLKVTTRLMHIIAWLLSQRAFQRGEIDESDLLSEKYSLGPASVSERELVAHFPFAVRALVEGSEELYDRGARLQDRMLIAARRRPAPEASPARMLMDRLHMAF